MNPKPKNNDKSDKTESSMLETLGMGAAALLGIGALGLGLYAMFKHQNDDAPDCSICPPHDQISITYASDDESNNTPPSKIYIIDLENIHSRTKDLTEKEAVYLGFISSTHHDVNKYSDWKKCESENFVTKFSVSNPKLLYIVEGRGKDLVNDKITELVPEIVEYIECCCSPTSTVFLVSKDHSMHTDTEWKLRKHLDKKGLTSIKIMWIPDQPFLSKSLDK